jgi:1-acyl-sn-glycerol-3-phosphate acyltransferase
MIPSAEESEPPRAAVPGLGARLRYYWTFVVAALCFVLLGVPLIPLGHVLRWLFGIEDFIYPFAKFGTRCYYRAAGARAQITGLEHLDPEQAYIFVANHQSNLDPALLFALPGRNLGALAKKELSRIPIFGQGMPLAHVIPIDRSNRERAIASTQAGAEVLRRGHSLMGFPEGTRSVDGRVREFKKGIFFMALEAGVPVVPVAINDTRLVMRKGSDACVPGEVSIEILPPVPTRGYHTENIEELVARVRQQIVARVKTD